MPFVSPLDDIRFQLAHVVDFAAVAATDRFAEATPDLTAAVLTEAARFCDEVMAPLNPVADTQGTRLENGAIRSPDGFAEAYRAMAEGGWIALTAPVAHGGMGLPLTLQTAVNDMMSGACMTLHLCPLLTQGQIEALEAHADPAMAALYLPRLISGAWSGTMNLTEPQAGSDVGALSTRALPNGDGTYAITGQKIYISWGDTDLAQNVVHLVLARLPDAPPGTRGISLFLVPRDLPDATGAPGRRNAVQVLGLEHKLGLHGAPTCVMGYDGATGWMVGPENGGMAAMFTMMNNARLAVGVQGVGIAEAATQAALAHARDRRQGRAGGTGAIIEHPDVRRMVMQMRAETFAARAIALRTAVALDLARATGCPDQTALGALLTPIAKAHGTEVGNLVAHLGIQVHGGLGFVEGTGVAQYARDVRVTTIYEGTNGIQAMDLVARKMADGGAAAQALLGQIIAGAEASRHGLAGPVAAAARTLSEATARLVTLGFEDRFAGAVPYLAAFARVLGADAHLRAAEAGDATRQALADFYIRRLLPDHAAHLAQALAGAETLMALPAEALG